MSGKPRKTGLYHGVSGGFIQGLTLDVAGEVLAAEQRLFHPTSSNRKGKDLPRNHRNRVFGNARRYAPLLTLCTVIASLSTAASAQYTFTKIADTTTSAPVGTFNAWNAISLSGGTVAFTGIFNSDSSVGIFTGSGGAITTIVKNGDAAPIGTFGLASQSPSISAGTTAFRGIYNSGVDSGIFTGNGGALTTIIKSGDAAPIGTFISSFNIGARSNGTTAFGGSYNGGSNSGIFTGSAGSLTTIVKSGDVAPSGTFNSFNNDGISNSNGTVAFNGSYNGSNWGIFKGNGGALTTIAKTGDAAPVGTFASGSFPAALSLPSISGGNVAFRGQYNGSDTGIFVGNGGALTTIVKTGDAAPSGTFDLFQDLSLSGSMVAFLGRYNSQIGLFTGNGGALSPILLPGDSLFGSTVTGVNLVRFDDTGNGSLAFSYFLADGRSGVARADISAATPEPGAVGLLLGMVGTGIVLRRRHASRKSAGLRFR